MLSDNLYALRSLDAAFDPASDAAAEWLDRFGDAFYRWSVNDLRIVRHLAHVPCGTTLIAFAGLDAGWIADACWTEEGLLPARAAIAAWTRVYVRTNPPPQRLGVALEKRHAERYSCLACWLPPYSAATFEETAASDMLATVS